MALIGTEYVDGFLAASPSPSAHDVDIELFVVEGRTNERNRRSVNRVLKGAFGATFAWLALSPAFGASFEGEWSGDLRCGPSLNAPANNPGFTNPLTMVVTGRKAKVTRDTKVVTETYSGQVSSNGQATFSGNGRYKAKEATWTARIDGRFSGETFSGSAEIYGENGRTARECSVKFARSVAETSGPSLKGAAVSAAPNRKPNVALDSTAIAPPAEVTKAAPPMPAATVAAEVTPVASPTPSDRTLIGTMKWGKSDSCLEVLSGQKAKCYGFAAQSAVENSLLVMGACLQGDKCSVTGVFDDDKELILSVASALASPRDVANSVPEQQPAAPAAVASTPSGLPTDAAASPKGFSGLGIGLAIAGIAALLMAIALFVRRGKGVKGTVQAQVVKPELTPSVVPMPLPGQLNADMPPSVAIVPAASDLTYKVSLRGIRPGESMVEVQQQLATLFKTTAVQVSALLAAPGYVVKKGANLAVATKYKSAIEAAGGVCEITTEEPEDFTLEVDLPQFVPSKPEARPEASYASTEPKISSSGTSQQAATGNLDPTALWNPKAAAHWSLILTPAFGSYLQMLNWQSLGEPQKAKVARGWFFCSLAVVAAIYLLPVFLRDPKTLQGVTRGLFLGYYFAWYYSVGRIQESYVKAKCGANYPRKKWAKPMLIWLGVALFVGLVIVFAEGFSATR